MKINVIAVGKIKEKSFADGIAEYAKRISRFADFKVVEISESAPTKTAAEQSAAESARAFEKAKGFVVALDSRGQTLTSEGFAAVLAEQTVKGVSEFSFIIGGSNGLTEEAKGKADLLLSFGRMTYPHQLFRLILTEQVYRALTINAGLPYHK